MVIVTLFCSPLEPGCFFLHGNSLDCWHFLPAQCHPIIRSSCPPSAFLGPGWCGQGSSGAEGPQGQYSIPAQGLVPASCLCHCCRAPAPEGPVGDAPSSLSPIADATLHPCEVGYGLVVGHGLDRHWHLLCVCRQGKVSSPPPSKLKGLEEKKK